MMGVLKHSFVRYVIVGFLSVGVDYGVLLLTYHLLNLDLGLSATIGFLTGLIVNFLLNKFWAFKANHSPSQSAKQAASVTLLVVFNLAVTNIVVVQLNEWHVGPELSKIITTGMITAWNYILYKKLIFKEPAPVV